MVVKYTELQLSMYININKSVLLCGLSIVVETTTLQNSLFYKVKDNNKGE